MTQEEQRRLSGLFPDSIEIRIDNEVADGDRRYVHLTVLDQFGGGEYVVREEADGSLSIVGGDSVIVSLEGMDIPAELARDLLGRDLPGEPDLEAVLPGEAELESVTAERRILGQGELNQRIHDRCIQSLELDRMNSKVHSPPECRQGRLACAWAVNRIASDIFGRPVGGGLSTANMFTVLHQSDRALPVNEYGPGCIIISPTAGGVVGHVGIIGREDLVYSNSSGLGRWVQNFTMQSWTAHYATRLGLAVHRFELDPRRFPVPLTS